MCAQVYSVPGQTERGRKTFSEWKGIDLSYEISLKCGGSDNYYKSVHHPIPTPANREYPCNFQNKSVSSAFNWVSRYIFFLGKLKGRGRSFLKGARRVATLWDYPQEHLVVIRDEKVSPFVKFEIILPLLCFLLDPLTRKRCRTRSSMINFAVRFQDMSKVKNLSVSKAEV